MAVINLLRVLLPAIGLLFASNALALEDYSGPNEDPVRTYTMASPPSGCLSSMNGAQLVSCAAAILAGSGLTGIEWGRTSSPFSTAGVCATRYGPVSAEPTVAAGASAIHFCQGTTHQGYVATETYGCTNTANRSLGVLGGATRCLSKCYYLRGQEVSAFVPIEDPAQVVTGACLFIEGLGSCELETLDASNYTYGTQLYRGGTFAHVGQRCTEDTSSAPSTGAVTQSPTGGTGAGSGGAANEGDTDATKAAMLSAIEGHRAGPAASLDALKADLDALKAPAFMPEGGRWLPSLESFFPSASECVLTVGHVPMLTRENVDLSISFCDWAPYTKDFFYWVFALMTMWGLWAMIFNTGHGGSH